MPGGKLYTSEEGGRGEGGIREYGSLVGDGSGDVCGVGVDECVNESIGLVGREVPTEVV